MKDQVPKVFYMSADGSHYSKYITDQVKLLIDQTFLDIKSACYQEDSVYKEGEDLEDRNGVVEIREFVLDADTGLELEPLYPVSLVGLDVGG